MKPIEQKILSLLLTNSRMPDSQVAKALKISDHQARYYRGRLERGVIEGSETVFDFGAVGLREHVIYLKISHLDEYQKSLHEYFRNHPNIKWVAEIFPEYSYRVSIVSGKVSEVENIVNDVEVLCEGNVEKAEVMQSREFLKKDNFTDKSMYRPMTKITLKKKEWELARSIYRDATVSLAELGKRHGMSIESVRQSLRRMEMCGFIQGYTFTLDKEKAGITFWAQACIRSSRLAHHLLGITNLLHSDHSFGRARRMFGTWNLEIAILAEDYDDLRRLIRKIEALFGPDMKGSSLFITQKKVVDHQFPVGIREWVTG